VVANPDYYDDTIIACVIVVWQMVLEKCSRPLFQVLTCSLLKNVNEKNQLFESFVFCLAVIVTIIDLLGDDCQSKQAETKVKIEIGSGPP